MTTRYMEIAVGLFIAIGAAALFILAMKVSNLAISSSKEGYTVYAYFENIGGLKVKSPVTVSGVKVGQVKQITYDEKELQAKVVFLINMKDHIFSTDTSASIYTAGLLGEQYIALEPGANDATLQEGDQITLTQSAIVLEEIISKFISSAASK
ncbi:MAG: outer membrane lipid asymmetry maintenance protein MlaD [Pseudomonadota bacterium]